MLQKIKIGKWLLEDEGFLPADSENCIGNL